MSVYVLHISNLLKASGHHVATESPTDTAAESDLNSWTKMLFSASVTDS